MQNKLERAVLYDDYGYECQELRVLPSGGDSNILCSKRGYLREIAYRKERNNSLGSFALFKLPAWEDLAVYDKIED